MASPSVSVPPVTVSVVSHGQWALVEPLLAQLSHWCAPHIAQVLLTVNRPEPGIRLPPLAFPLTRIDNDTARGFGANHNAAFAQCRTPWFLVLNPDIRLDRDVLAAMLEQARPDAGLLAPRIREPGKPAPEPYRDLLTPLELLRKRRAGHRAPPAPAWVAGMFMLLRREAFAQLHGFDKRYFMYCEDFDLCARLRLAGWQLQVTPGVEVLHEAQRASNSSLRPLAWHLGSLARVWTSGAFWRYRRLLAV
ncbi:MAG TPA: glycosyltransferase family 2 protein [Ramlibacter sp.]|jgi:GT2 family glycosyltransferase|uniref:glycosyltransferase family 2 protein n=1 Tax=Ramlibacter sp. TaxID=1917967 RepID=UPI002D3FDA6A|nr:glycosyltransferase family 2 protein [Ramlibacter sp.]HZY20077.1 glycosyltransferase family 2 protein [Ramlibacter sp.]